MNTKHRHRIAIIGAGFSGTAIVTQLIRSAKSPLRIFLFDQANQFATGLAYSTTSHQHLLNVHTNNLGLFSDQHDDFYKWLSTPHGREAAHVSGIKPDSIPGDSFLPRALYGKYLKSILDLARHEAGRSDHDLQIIHALVKDVTPQTSNTGWNVYFDQCHEQVDQVVLATGNESPSTLHLSMAQSQQFPNLPAKIWTLSNLDTSPQELIRRHLHKNIFLLGTGLTMADVVLELQSLGHTGHITALSRHGSLPRKHTNATTHTDWSWHNNPEAIPKTATHLYEQLEIVISDAQSKNINWRSIIDSIRPLTQSIWINLPEHEKRLFTKHHQSLWNVLRHRMPPATHDAIKFLITKNKLSVVPGTITKITAHNTHFNIEYNTNSLHQKIESQLIIDCTGPNMQLKDSRNPLILNLLQQKLISPGPLGVGVALSEGHRVKSSYTSPVYAIGALIIGELWECNAIPELRQQAQSVALELLQFATSSLG